MIELYKHVRLVSVYNTVLAQLFHSFLVGNATHGRRIPDTFFSSLVHEGDGAVTTWLGLLVMVLIS